MPGNVTFRELFRRLTLPQEVHEPEYLRHVVVPVDVVGENSELLAWPRAPRYLFGVRQLGVLDRAGVMFRGGAAGLWIESLKFGTGTTTQFAEMLSIKTGGGTILDITQTALDALPLQTLDDVLIVPSTQFATLANGAGVFSGERDDASAAGISMGHAGLVIMEQIPLFVGPGTDVGFFSTTAGGVSEVRMLCVVRVPVGVGRPRLVSP